MGGVAHYSYYKPDPVLTSATETSVTFTVSGNVQGYTSITCGCPPGIYHQPQIKITLKDHATGVKRAGGCIAYGPQVSPPTNVNFSAHLGFTASAPGNLIDDDTEESIFCSLAGLFAFQAFHAELKGTFTRADWLGTPAPVCSGSPPGPQGCRYVTINNCILPPDMPVAAVDSGDFRGIATYLSWKNAGVCFRFLSGQRWTCTSPRSLLSSSQDESTAARSSQPRSSFHLSCSLCRSLLLLSFLVTARTARCPRTGWRSRWAEVALLSMCIPEMVDRRHSLPSR